MRVTAYPDRIPLNVHESSLDRSGGDIAPVRLRAGRFEFSLGRPLLMGVVNVTPDSFSDGGRHGSTDLAIAHALRLAAEGADILDIGGESTRPGSLPVPADIELARVLPVIEAWAPGPVPVSVDTGKAAVIRAALGAGASMINDVWALRLPGSLAAAAAGNAAVCLMHMRGEPRHMQVAPAYRDVTAEVVSFLRDRIAACEAAGFTRDRIVVDPGYGFGKRARHNLQLIRRLGAIVALGQPVLAGISRKSMLGAITGHPEADRVHASVAAALALAARGASILRVHDVAATRDALAVWLAIEDDEFELPEAP